MRRTDRSPKSHPAPDLARREVHPLVRNSSGYQALLAPSLARLAKICPPPEASVGHRCPISRGDRQKKSPAPIAWSRAYTWRRPTLTRPIVSLPLALQRFTSGFGMGPGGSTALWSPEGNPISALAVRDWDSEDLSLASFRPLPDIHTENFQL